jgi:hypothetical protein
MFIPLAKKKKYQQVKHKICSYPGCAFEYFGLSVQKYCDFHKHPENRKRKRSYNELPDIKNRVFNHSLREVTEIEFNCAFDGCTESFLVKVFPRQFVYPKYCEYHRNEYHRFYDRYVNAMERKAA